MIDLWWLVSQMQIFFLILITQGYTPDAVVSVITGLKFTLNPYEFVPLKNIGIYESAVNNFDFKLSNQFFDTNGIKSDSTVYNLFSFTTFIVLMAILHLFIYLLNKLFLRCSNEGKWAWVIKILKWIIQKAFIIFTFEYYIRSSLEINQYLLISSINEINIFNTSRTFKITSLIVACMMLMLCLVLFMVTVYLAFSSYNLNENEHNKLGEFYVGLKQQKKFTSYTPSVILRRTVFVIILITMASSSSVFVTGILSFLQLVYLIYVAWGLLIKWKTTWLES